MEDIQNCYACFQKKPWAPHSKECLMANPTGIPKVDGCTGCDSADYVCPIRRPVKEKDSVLELVFNPVISKGNDFLSVHIAKKAYGNLVFGHLQETGNTWVVFNKPLMRYQVKLIEIVLNVRLTFAFNTDKGCYYCWSGWYQKYKTGWVKVGCADMFNAHLDTEWLFENEQWILSPKKDFSNF